ncbi:MAG: hypothetical protein IPL61_11775 [Myxococcales bacterium]|nr:hypothetical protein [Myxococcales bacterium]
MPKSVAIIFVVLALTLGAACEKTNHASIDKWLTSKKGLSKLKSTMKNGSIDPDLSAHAAENLYKRGNDQDAKAMFDAMAPARRDQVLAKLAPRLWAIARIEGEMAQPTSLQEIGKDALFELRPLADDETRAVIDGYLTDWLTGGYYEGRAATGRFRGAAIMRALGPKAGERLIAVANRVIAAPDKDGRRPKIGDQLLLGLAASGSPDAVKLVVEIAVMDRGDSTLTERAINALYQVYIDPAGLFPVGAPAALATSLDRLGAIARDDNQSARIANDAVELIRAAGLPGCLDPLLAMVNQAHRDPRFRWVGANNAIRCGGAKALTEVAGSLSTRDGYQKEILMGAVVTPLAQLGDRDGLIAAAQALTTSSNWVARWIGIEALASLGGKAEVERIAALGGDKAKLLGYWGDQSDLPKKEQKPLPTLGQRATELAATLR